MSNYSYSYDFRDFISDTFDNSWEKFKAATGGLLYRIDANDQMEFVSITEPADLIPYYPHSIDSVHHNNSEITIVLGKESHVDRVIDTMEDLNAKYEIPNYFEPFNTDELRNIKQLLSVMYREAKLNNVKTIIG